MTNKQLIEKADLTLAELEAGGGYMLPEQADKFIKEVQVQPTILRDARVLTMTKPKQQFSRWGFGSRILRKGVEGTELSAADRTKPDFAPISLTTSEVIAEVDLTYDQIEENIQGGNINARGGSRTEGAVNSTFKDDLVRMMAERAALDLEELGLYGDTTNIGDDFLTMLDGWMVQANTHIVDHLAAPVDKSLFKAGLKVLPKQYHRNLSVLRNYMSVAQELEYRDSLANRDTSLGDSVIEGFRGVAAYGVPVEKAPLMSETEGLLTHPKNLLFGIQRQISIEVEKLKRARKFVIVLTAKVAYGVEDPNALVKYTNIGV